MRLTCRLTRHRLHWTIGGEVLSFFCIQPSPDKGSHTVPWAPEKREFTYSTEAPIPEPRDSVAEGPIL